MYLYPSEVPMNRLCLISRLQMQSFANSLILSLCLWKYHLCTERTCGTPDKTGAHSEKSPFTTACVL